MAKQLQGREKYSQQYICEQCIIELTLQHFRYLAYSVKTNS